MDREQSKIFDCYLQAVRLASCGISKKKSCLAGPQEEQRSAAPSLAEVARHQHRGITCSKRRWHEALSCRTPKRLTIYPWCHCSEQIFILPEINLRRCQMGNCLQLSCPQVKGGLRSRQELTRRILNSAGPGFAHEAAQQKSLNTKNLPACAGRLTLKV